MSDVTKGTVLVLPSNKCAFGCRRKSDKQGMSFATAWRGAWIPLAIPSRYSALLHKFKKIGWRAAGLEIIQIVASSNVAIVEK